MSGVETNQVVRLGSLLTFFVFSCSVFHGALLRTYVLRLIVSAALSRSASWFLVGALCAARTTHEILVVLGCASKTK